MEDSSFAIHPGKKKQLKGTNYQDVGALVSYKKENQSVQIVCENGFVTIFFIRADIVRIIMNPKEKPSLATSFAVIKEPESIGFSIQEDKGLVEIHSKKLKLSVTKSPLRISIYNDACRLLVSENEHGMGFNEKKEVICFKEMDEDDHFYGFGEKTSFLDKRGEKMTMWNSDVFAPHNPEIDALYQSIPYFMTVRDGKAHGIFFDNTFKTAFDMKTSTEMYSFWAEGGQIDYYVFLGPSPKDVLEQYTTITGRMPLPPKWALGYHQSRYSYETEKEVRELVSQFLEKEIPIDAVYLDIHYMDGYRVFTFDEERFPNPEALIRDLQNIGIHVVPIVDPGVKEDPEYSIYQEGIQKDNFCKYIEGNIYFGEVWPGNSAFPDFTNTHVRKWWGEKHKFYTELGIEGIWNDMNEPAVFNETKTMDVKVMHGNDGQPKTHRELHNVYGFFMGESTYEGLKKQLNGKRPFLLTRAGYAGVQRYGTVWTGDNRSFWEHLQMALPMCMNLGMSGVPFCGPDVGGFAHDATGQLLARWTQFGTFTPYFRNHSALDTVRQEPWSFGEEVEKNVKKYIEQRYVWMPHLYTLFKEASKTGVPVMRPLVMEYPTDENTFNLSDQFMVGEQVIVAPILTPDTFHRVVYLPEGNWVNYWTDEKLTGKQHHLINADIETLPIFVKEGAILPHGSVKRSTEVPDKKVTIHIYPKQGEEISYHFYEDDGKTFDYEKGKSFESTIRCIASKQSVEITLENVNTTFTPSWKEWKLVIHQLEEVTSVRINGKEITLIDYDKDTKIGKLTIDVI
ncbi:glycoside hydrolase family 31 protein [Bacillus sp. FJAT-45350]|uniref:glycoside hydrolase family 31 protein n=1 Tax=Bacillus sp. FJAT-45350 TaxID=2011014 RepID=UPI000BB8E5FE|nr:glycoside hydrolase family 31 protein [Bacillus sp. FJAT-45350]